MHNDDTQQAYKLVADKADEMAQTFIRAGIAPREAYRAAIMLCVSSFVDAYNKNLQAAVEQKQAEQRNSSERYQRLRSILGDEDQANALWRAMLLTQLTSVNSFDTISEMVERRLLRGDDVLTVIKEIQQ